MKFSYKQIILVITIIFIIFFAYKYFVSRPVTDSDVDADKFEELSKQLGVVILDVRSAFEFKGEKIQGAQNISFSSIDFNQRIQNLDKNTTYLIYCESGTRSAGAAKTMRNMGFTHT